MSDGNEGLIGPVLDPETVERQKGARYPAPFDADCAGRERRALGEALGLKNFGVNLLRLPPGYCSSQRHWHTRQDEFVMLLEGEAVLVTNAGEQVMRPGMVAGFQANSGDGHRFINRSDQDALFLEVGDHTAGDEVDYSDIDLQARVVDGVRRYVHNDGTPYE